MNAAFVIARQTFRLLRRDQVFIPVVLAGLLITGFANIASDWSVEDFSKILFDIGGFGFAVTGSLVALFWGTKILGDARSDGAVEVELSTSISRAAWLAGKYLGIALTLVLLGVILIVIWQMIMLANNFGWMTEGQLLIFLLMIVGWLAVAATAVFFSAFCGTTVAVFCTFCAWMVGLVAALVAGTLTDRTSPAMAALVRGAARFWDFQQFNAIQHAVTMPPLTHAEMLMRFGYGAVLIAILVSAGCMIFDRKDLLS